MSFIRMVLLSCALASLAITALGQSTSGAISGEISDSLGEVIPGATITIKSLETSVIRQVVSRSSGNYRIVGLPPGRYEIKAERPGFSPEAWIVTVTVAEEFVVNLSLKPANVTEEITVSTDLAGVELANGAQSGLANEKTVRDLPLNGRDVAQLILLQPGVTNSRGSAQTANTGRGTRFSTAGARPSQNNFQLDGTTINDTLNNTPGSAQGLLIGVETIKEFRVLTSTFSAEHGRAAGGVFLAVTKSGTNDFHGSVFEFLRDNSLNARNFFDQQKPEFRRNQYGAAIGGPIIRNKTFFFGSYEGLRENKGVGTWGIVPDDNARLGILPSQSPITIDPRSVPLINLYPRANGQKILDTVTGAETGVAEFFGLTQRPSRDDFFTVKVDHNFSDKDMVMARYLFDDSFQVLPRFFPQYFNQAVNRKQVATIEWRKIIGSSIVNEARFGFNRSTPSELVPTPDDTGVSFIAGQPVGEINITGLTPVGTDRTNPKLFFQNNFQISDSLSINRSRHGIKLGAVYERFQFNGSSQTRTRGRLRFRTLPDLLRFRVRDLEGAKVPSDFVRGYRQDLFGAFVQDDLKIMPRFTLNIGVRYEFVTTPSEVNGKIANLRNILDPNVTVGGDFFQTPKTGIAPRVGFAFDPFGDGKTAIRGGFGLFYDHPLFSTYRSPGFGSLPFANTSRLSGAQVTTLPVDPLAFQGGLKATDQVQFDVQPSYVMQYSLNAQRDILGVITSLTYVGSRGVNLWGQSDINTAIPQILPDGRSFFPANATRRNPNFDQVRGHIQGFNSWYNALSVGTLKRFNKGLQFQLSYTYGKSLDERSGVGGRLEYTNGQARAFDPYDRRLDRGRSDFDVRHNFTANLTYDMPFGKAKGIPGAIIRDWQINSIVMLASGVPFTPLIDGDPDRDGTDDNSARPDLVPGVSLTPPGGRTPDLWFNPLALAPPQVGFRGTLGRNTFDGPDWKSVDLSLSRKFKLSEKYSLQFRVEAFNLLNRANFDLPANSDDGVQVFTFIPASGSTPASFPRTPNAGRIFNTVGGPRELQLGVKFLF